MTTHIGFRNIVFPVLDNSHRRAPGPGLGWIALLAQVAKPVVAVVPVDVIAPYRVAQRCGRGHQDPVHVASSTDLGWYMAKRHESLDLKNRSGQFWAF